MIAPTFPNDTKAPYDLIMDVTPELACRWLEANTQNRVVNPAHVDRLVRDMKAGRWYLTHQGIAFDTHGLLVDGQHRLWAILEADVPVWTDELATLRAMLGGIGLAHEPRTVLEELQLLKRSRDAIQFRRKP